MPAASRITNPHPKPRVLVLACLVAFAALIVPCTAAFAQSPPQSNCEIDDDPLQRECIVPVGLAQKDNLFTANGATVDGEVQTTLCTVSMRQATPPGADMRGRVQFRVQPVNRGARLCDNPLKIVELDSKLVNVATGQQWAASRSLCHNTSACGGPQETATMDVGGLDFGEYIHEATFRLVLNEPSAPIDPWTEVQPDGTTPTDTKTPPEPNGQGICAPGTTVVRCTFRVKITVAPQSAAAVLSWLCPGLGMNERCRPV